MGAYQPRSAGRDAGDMQPKPPPAPSPSPKHPEHPLPPIVTLLSPFTLSRPRNARDIVEPTRMHNPSPPLNQLHFPLSSPLEPLTHYILLLLPPFPSQKVQ